MCRWCALLRPAAEAHLLQPSGVPALQQQLLLPPTNCVAQLPRAAPAADAADVHQWHHGLRCLWSPQRSVAALNRQALSACRYQCHLRHLDHPKPRYQSHSARAAGACAAEFGENAAPAVLAGLAGLQRLLLQPQDTFRPCQHLAEPITQSEGFLDRKSLRSNLSQQ